VTPRSTGLAALQRKPVTFYGTRSTRAAARVQLRRHWAWRTTGPGRWQREWKLYSSVHPRLAAQRR
jgi:hypothetical protein